MSFLSITKKRAGKIVRKAIVRKIVWKIKKWRSFEKYIFDRANVETSCNDHSTEEKDERRFASGASTEQPPAERPALFLSFFLSFLLCQKYTFFKHSHLNDRFSNDFICLKKIIMHSAYKWDFYNMEAGKIVSIAVLYKILKIKKF